jgi:hypothetical protein
MLSFLTLATSMGFEMLTDNQLATLIFAAPFLALALAFLAGQTALALVAARSRRVALT